jgi:magnesium and cobalt transporter
VFSTNFADPDVDTIGGFVTDHVGRLPRRGESITIGSVVFEVLRADARQLHVLMVTPAPLAPIAPHP